MPTGWCVADGILEQVAEDLGQTVGIGAGRQRVGDVDRELNPGGPQGGGSDVDRGPDGSSQIELYERRGGVRVS